ncbi:MAG TPA: metallophosphoesterase [Acidimicrobiales bacterium]|nr:metallophosphoesterase [Acidimicrobiales bacterium]
MADIRFVIVSDLHFGAENSVLTPLSESAPTRRSTGFAVDEDSSSPLLVGLVEAVRQLTEQQSRPPTLVLAGDILDMALSPDEYSSAVFSGFARLAFGGRDPVFDPVVYYVPGNHDHHLWETAREAQYVEHLRSIPLDSRLGAPCHVTSLKPDDESPQVSSAWLASLVQREEGAAAAQVRVAYPNMALLHPSGDRALVISHGHFTESIYTMMSQLKSMLYPDQPRDLNDVTVWEEENFAWIDFLWSTLGRSGQVGSDLGLIYADMATPTDMDTLASNLTAALLKKGAGPDWLHKVEGAVINSIVKHETVRNVRSERGTTTTTLSPKGQAGLRSYLEGPVRTQLEVELGTVPQEVSFVFGHTHKPFADRWQVAGFPSPVRIFNTGGWVVDTAAPAPVQGGVALLVDDQLDVVPLQVYRQAAGSPPPPQLLASRDDDGSPSEFTGEIAARVDPRAEPWAAITAAASSLTAQRYRLQAITTETYRAAGPRSPLGQ